MSAVLTRRRRSGRGREQRDHRQPSLFSQVVAPPPLADEPRAAVAAPVREPEAPLAAPADGRVEAPSEAPALASRTLDDAISALWGELVTGEPAGCPVCGSALTPRHSAGAGVVGGRCGTCATTLA